MSNDLHEMAARLREAGYLVVKIPPCRHENRPHGRHPVITRSAICEGSDPLPHGYSSGYFGSFGWLVICACGHSFRTYTGGITGDGDPDEETDWDAHKREHNIAERRQ